eukprot:CAMPEP_0194049226 /NCGR_PEP_ID=MMETSP0009_2-20130614/30049_1 /TAXON_ID=210454 /ORGANISM="Grammatophora oceanica, Strain CCMP 410" /LENGTH=335 /DNA_ID=CAMNT_0038695331 /DNA_START=131 /DNA_END=1138 /DNA_ORIENTATION=+
MMFRNLALTSLALSTVDAFTTPSTRAPFTVSRTISSTELAAGPKIIKEKMLFDIPGYAPGKGDGELAKRYGHLAGAEIKTVGEAFAQFTKEAGNTISPLYKNYMSDIVGITHLIVVNARFQRDPLWSYGIKKTMDMYLKNYPEPDIKDRLYQAFFKSVDQDVKEIEKEAAVVEEWVKGKKFADVEAALMGEGDSFLAKIVNEKIKPDEFWMYSRYFTFGLIGLMEETEVDDLDKEVSFNIIEDVMKNKLKLPHIQACRDSDTYWKKQEKLMIMETMMKEIEIREKKRMADRLEQKAEAALAAAEELDELRKKEAEAVARAAERAEAGEEMASAQP